MIPCVDLSLWRTHRRNDPSGRALKRTLGTAGGIGETFAVAMAASPSPSMAIAFAWPD
ncbi:hypothetical protein B4113_4047 [Geobacillus sp. B4113_201601]|nr:hypothetical protein B4113_4047 [Geobacillus sp. B4113_201601]